MMFPIQYLPVNWIDGMKVSKNHFSDSDKHVQDLVRDASSIALNNFNFGLLPPYANSKIIFDLSVHESAGNVLEATLKYCNAVTLGGFKISIDLKHQENPALSASIKGNTQDGAGNNELSWLEIILIADPYDRVPVGIPALEESPPRHPYSDVKYALKIVPSDQINLKALGAFHLVIGRIKNKGGFLSAVENYIPPCYNIYSHPELMSYYELFSTSLQNIQNYSFRIIRKIFEKNKPSNLAKNFTTLCTETLSYIAGISFKFRNQLPHEAPVNTVECFSTMAHINSSALQCINPEEKEELLKYIFEWCDITPSDIERILSAMVDIKYNHYDINESMTLVRNYLNTVEMIWNKMNTLEFIGQRKENIVVTNQTIHSQTEKPKKRWSILD